MGLNKLSTTPTHCIRLLIIFALLRSIFFRTTASANATPSPPISSNYTPRHRGDLQIINISQHILTTDETKQFQKGLSFVPTSQYNSFHWVKDVNLFIRKIKWARFFLNKDRERSSDLGLDQTGLRTLEELLEEGNRLQGTGPFTDLKRKSKKYPPLDNTTYIDTFLELVTKELKDLSAPRHGTTQNITKGKLEALRTLANDKTLRQRGKYRGNEFRYL